MLNFHVIYVNIITFLNLLNFIIDYIFIKRINKNKDIFFDFYN